jgi:hypothetical protein
MGTRDKSLEEQEMTTATEGKAGISFAESFDIIANRVGKFLATEFRSVFPGLVLCSTDGRRPFGPRETNHYGIMQEHDRPPTFLEWVFGRPRPFVADLWFKDKVEGATPKRWVLKVYGRQHADFFREIGEKLAAEFRVEIHIQLASEDVKWEYFPD